MNYIRLASRLTKLITKKPLIFFLFVFLSVLSALTEGLSISLLIPMLDTQSMGSSFSSIPLLGKISIFFEGMEGREKLLLAAMLMLIVVIFRGVLQIVVQAIGVIMSVSVQKNLTEKGFGYLLKSDLKYINKYEHGEHLNNIKERPARITFLLRNFADVISLVFIFIIYSVMMMLISWEMTLFSIGILGLISWIMKKFTTIPVKRLGMLTSGAQSKFNQIIFETLGGINLIRLKSNEDNIYKKFINAFSYNLDIHKKISIYHTIPGPATTMSVGVFICALLVFSAAFVDGDISQVLSQLFLFLFLLMRLSSPVLALNNCRNAIVSNIPALDEMEDFIREIKFFSQSDGDWEFEGLRNAIELKELSFCYNQVDGKVLKNVSTTFEKGKMFAIVGKSGSGKSTLVNLLSRLYIPEKGEILIDGVNLQHLKVSSWRNKLSVVSQDIVLFNDSVANNISFGQDKASREEIVRAAKLAAAHDFITNLSEGYDTALGDRGVRLSGGQKQRIAIARAFLANPEILVMDEGTSNLDSATEMEIQKAVESLRENRTMIIIAHRLSTIRKADKIIVMNDGSIVEEGSHLELINMGGRYAEMIDNQRLDLID